MLAEQELPVLRGVVLGPWRRQSQDVVLGGQLDVVPRHFLMFPVIVLCFFQKRIEHVPACAAVQPACCIHAWRVIE